MTYRQAQPDLLAEVSGNLRLEKTTRNSYQQTKVGKSSGIVGDEGGHMIGTQFGGRGDGPLHLVPQSMKLNRGAGSKWTAMERAWASELKKGNKVSVNIEVDWPKGSKRPDGFNVRYSVTNIKTGVSTPKNTYFPNQ